MIIHHDHVGFIPGMQEFFHIYISINIIQHINACSSFISQVERMSEYTVETLERDLGLHFISKMGLTCL